MTQQYLCGEMSLRLARLERVAAGQAPAGEVVGLRREAETTPPTALAWVAVRALRLADALCWDSLQQGDVGAFADEAAISADLREFAICADLLDEE